VCIAQFSTGPCPRQVSLVPQVRHVGGRQSVSTSHGRWHVLLVPPRKRHDGRSGLVQSTSVEHEGPVAEQVFGAMGTTGFIALLTSIDWTVTRTWVSGVGSRVQPARTIPANPVGRLPWTGLVMRTITWTWGVGSSRRR